MALRQGRTGRTRSRRAHAHARAVIAEALESRRLLAEVIGGIPDHGEEYFPAYATTPSASAVFTGEFVVKLTSGVSSQAKAAAHQAKHERTHHTSADKHLWSFKGKSVRTIRESLKRDPHVLEAHPIYSEPAPALDSELNLDEVMPDQPEAEPNGTAATANPSSISTSRNTITGSISSSSDVDFYSFSLSARSGVFFDIDSRDVGLSATLDTVLTVYDSTGAIVHGANNNGRDFETFTLNDTTSTAVSADSSLYLDLNAGTYVVRVSPNTTSGGDYQLKLWSDSTYTSSVPVFNSLPGATDTLFLDFNGHSASDNWGTYSIQSYDINGNAGEWTPLERLVVETVWRGVADDYSPFNLNVSTSYGGAFSDAVGFRQIIGNSTGSELGYGAGTLGVAFLNSYAGGGSGNNAAFTFGSNFSAQQTTETAVGSMNSSYLARAVEMANTSSHEFGHALGLRHYGGTNSQLNALMHTPDFGLSRERWVSGLTHSGESPVISQNDVAVISNATNSFGYRADDAGNSLPAANVLPPIANGYRVSGVLHQTTDVDYFRFSGSGSTTLTLNISEHTGNLDGEVYLYDSGGALLSSNDGTNLSAGLTFSLPSPGDYYVEVRSDGGPGEIGQYTLAILTAIPGATGAITGRIFRDANLNHLYEQAAGDVVLSDATVYLDLNSNAIFDDGEPSTLSIVDGTYSISGLVNGTYSVRHLAPANYVSNIAYSAVVSGGGTVADRNFGNFPTLYTGGANNNTFTIRRNPGDTSKVEVIDSLLGFTYTAPTALITSIAFQTTIGSDSLTIDYANGIPLPSGNISYDGGSETDTLTILGSAAADTIVLNTLYAGNVGVANIESATMSGGDGNDLLTASTGVTTAITFDGGSNTDTFRYDATTNPETINVNASTIVNGVLTHSFSATESLIINAGASNDIINVATSAAGPAVTVDGGQAHDTVVVNSGSTVSVNGGIDLGNDSVTVAAGANAVVSFDGGVGGGIDTATFNATGAADTITVNTGSIVGGGSSLSFTATDSVVVNALGGEDLFNVNSWSSTGNVAVTLSGGDANDTFNIGNGSIASITGNVTVTGQGGNDAVVINDTSLSASESYTLSSTTFDRSLFGSLAYDTMESFTLNAPNGNNAITISGTSTPVTINANNGNDTLTISGAPSSSVVFNGGTNPAYTDTLNVNAGMFTFDDDAIAGTLALNVNVNNAAASVVFKATQHIKALNLVSGTATMSPNGSRVLVVDTLSVTGGKLSLADNDLIVSSGVVGSWNGSAYTDITGLVQSGRGDGSWNGASGIVTSMSDATGGILTTLAVSTAAELGVTTFAGETVSGSNVLVKYTWGGDADQDGDLDGDDYFWIDQNIAQSGAVFGHHQGDFDYDGDIDGDDYFIIDSNIAFAQTQPTM